MALLAEKDKKVLSEHLQKNLKNPVTLLYFTQSVACQFCRETQQVLEELAELSDLIALDIKNFVTDKDVADQYGIDKIPATVVVGDKDYGVRFFGIPSGYEFTSLVEAVVEVSKGDTNLSKETLDALAKIEAPIDIQVFVTPTCPYCPTAVRMAQSLAVASDKVNAAMVEAIEFPHLAQKYGVQGVPRSIFNGEIHLEGAAPEALFVAKLLQSAGLLEADQVDEVMQTIMAAHEHDE